MRERETIAIYPFDSNAEGLLLNKDFICQYDKVVICPLKGWQVDNIVEEAMRLNDYLKGKMSVQKSFEGCLKNCNTVAFVDSEHECYYGTHLYPQMIMAAAEGKNVIDLLKTNPIENELSKACFRSNVNYSVYRGKESLPPISEDNIKEGLLDINTPIVIIVGEAADTQKFTIQAALKRSLSDKGYKVVVVGSKTYSRFLNDECFPLDIFNNGFSDAEQVILFNRYIKRVEKEKTPDLIIIGIPGGMLRCTNRIVGDFGVLAYKVLQAISPDYLIVSLLFAEYYQKFFDDYKSLVSGRFGVSVDLFHLSNRLIDWEELEGLRLTTTPIVTISDKNLYETVDRMREKIKDTNIATINRMKDIDTMTDMIVEKLGIDENEIIF